MDYIITRNDELYHYGVKGMKWGIRRYQNKDGTLTAKGEAKVAKYIEKESNILNKTHDRRTRISNRRREKQEEQYKKAVLKYGSESKKAKRKAEYYISESYRKHCNDKIFIEEMNRVKKMSLSDISEERKAIGKAVTESVLLDIGSVGVGVVLKAPIIPMFYPDIEKVKRNNRIDGDGFKRVHDIAVEKTRQDYDRLNRDVK